MFTHSFQTSARFADLDTQRHVTSRTYEDFCMEGRFRLLFEFGQLPQSAKEQSELHAGLSLEAMLAEHILLQPEINYIKFFKEQQPGAQLTIQTQVYPLPAGRLGWYQEVLNATGDVACVNALITQTHMGTDKTTQPDLLPQSPISLADFHQQEKMQRYKIDLATPLPGFPGSCQQVQSPYRFLYSDRTPFYDYPLTAVWRIFEEGRWSFGDAMGFSREKIMELDTVTFFTSATFQIHSMPQAGQLLQINSWVEKIEKIRLHLRQDLVDPASGQIYISMRDEQLVVSLQKRRPKKAEGEFLQIIQPYVE